MQSHLIPFDSPAAEGREEELEGKGFAKVDSIVYSDFRIGSRQQQ
jgi:hypothetical protein